MLLTKTTGQKANNIGKDVFDAIIRKSDLETGNDLDCVGFRAELGLYTITYHGEMKDNYSLVVEDFGKMQKGKWVECEPTDRQKEEMSRIMALEIKCIEEKLERERVSEYSQQDMAWNLAELNWEIANGR